MKVNGLVAQLKNTITECGNCHLLAWERSDDFVNLRASLETSKEGYKHLGSWFSVIQKNLAVVLERDACYAKVRRLQVRLHCYRDASKHVAKRVTDKGIRLKARRAAVANKAEDELSHF